MVENFFAGEPFFLSGKQGINPGIVDKLYR
jgi:hypothetical protein